MTPSKKLFLPVFLLVAIAHGDETPCHRPKRALIFPRANPARHQLVAGFGIPADIEYIESVTLGYVFKAVYFLPWNSSHWVPQFLRRDEDTLFEPVDLLNQQQRRNFVEAEKGEDGNWAERSRGEIYRALEAMADQKGHNGRSCLLRTICEAAEARFSHVSGIFGELLHILFTPSSTVDHHPNEDYTWAETLPAQYSPRQPGGSICSDMFAECPFSLLGLFTGITG
ncbi:hypothetical protein quinque_016361 [Culex quinquefasciatus]